MIEFLIGAIGGGIAAMFSPVRTTREIGLSILYSLIAVSIITLWYSINPVEAFFVGFAGTELLQRLLRLTIALTKKQSVRKHKRGNHA